MNKKKRTLKALLHFMLEVEQNPDTVSVGVTENCGFCIIHLSETQLHIGAHLLIDELCNGCPFANEDGNPGCAEFSTYRKLRFENPGDDVLFLVTQNLKAILKVLISIPAERFTRKGWKYFKELKHLI